MNFSGRNRKRMNRNNSGIIGKYFSGIKGTRSRSQAKRKIDKKKKFDMKKAGIFTRKSDRERNMKFFQKRKKRSDLIKNSIVPKNLDLENAAVIFNRKKNSSASLISSSKKPSESLNLMPKKYGRSFQNPFKTEDNYTEDNEGKEKEEKKIENSKDFIKNFLKKKEKNEEISKLSHYITNVNKDINTLIPKSSRKEEKDSRRKQNKRSFKDYLFRSLSRSGRKKKKKEKKAEIKIKPNYYMKSLEYYYLMKKEDYFAEIYKKHFHQTHNSMKFIKLIDKKKADEFVLQQKLNLKKSPFYLQKKTIVLDLDETLVHCSKNNIGEHKLKIPVSKKEFIDASFFVRPYAKQILKRLSSYFEIIIFTASHRFYADRIISFLDPEGVYVSHRVFRDHCFLSKQGVYIKDLRIFNRKMKDILLVDNAAYSFAFQIDNGIPIIPFYNSKEDAELLFLCEYLVSLKDVEDFRPHLKETFKLGEYSKYPKLKDCFNEIFNRKK